MPDVPVPERPANLNRAFVLWLVIGGLTEIDMVRTVRVWWPFLVPVLLLAGCAGDPPPSPPPAPPALTLDQQAAWAFASADPCAFVAGEAEPKTTRYCVVRLPGGSAAKVALGGFGHAGRKAAKAVTIGELLAYQRAADGACETAFPLSFTKAVMVTTPGACAPGEPNLVAAARKLRGDLDALARPAPVNPVTRWDLCELLTTALRLEPDPSGPPSPDSEQGCSNQFGVAGPSLRVTVRPGASVAPAGPPGPDEVSLGDVNARVSEEVSPPGVDLPPTCGLRWDEGAVGGPAAGVYELSLATETRCAEAVNQAKAVRSTLRNAPGPPRPKTLGITPDQPDEASPAACRIVDEPAPGCRAAVPAEVPRGADAIMTAGSENADILCTMLAAGIRQAAVGEPRVANNVTGCVGTYGDASMTVELKLAGYSPSATPEPVTLGGLPGFAENYGTARFVDLSPYRDLARPASVRLSVNASIPDPPAESLAVADRIATAIGAAYFG
ncbi:hypothetical protein [Amycolatopsis australiensis]|uniref:Uncharacterized protein n=1 Tax=Amycolatopsis australiensis TaxID=546364 RepID=A0A1K1S2H5_9PSEU|nr:hypothetical protein [Amycolatopsis australiensis]SFW78261.1 hypothetical protein SAMN04489730_4482 [Amycolatopsis australiensis]